LLLLSLSKIATSPEIRVPALAKNQDFEGWSMPIEAETVSVGATVVSIVAAVVAAVAAAVVAAEVGAVVAAVVAAVFSKVVGLVVLLIGTKLLANKMQPTISIGRTKLVSPDQINPFFKPLPTLNLLPKVTLRIQKMQPTMTRMLPMTQKMAIQLMKSGRAIRLKIRAAMETRTRIIGATKCLYIQIPPSIWYLKKVLIFLIFFLFGATAIAGASTGTGPGLVCAVGRWNWQKPSRYRVLFPQTRHFGRGILPPPFSFYSRLVLLFKLGLIIKSSYT
jgi:hypothetical protein